MIIYIYFRDACLAIVMLKDPTIVLAIPLLVSVNADLVLLDNIVMHVFLTNTDSVGKVASLVIVIISVLKICSVTLVDNVQYVYEMLFHYTMKSLIYTDQLE